MELLTLDEVAKLLKRSPSTVYRWISNNEIPYLKIGHRVLFNQNELFDWIQSHSVPTTLEKADIKIS